MLRVRLSLRVGHYNGAADGHDAEEIVDGEVEGERGEGERGSGEGREGDEGESEESLPHRP